MANVGNEKREYGATDASPIILYGKRSQAAKDAYPILGSPEGKLLINDYDLQYAIDRILNDYGDTVSVDTKLKPLLKYGRNQNVGSAATGYTIWYTGQDQAHETYLANSVNTINSFSSSATGDTISIKVEGHTDTAGEKTFIVQSTTLNGQNTVTIGTGLNRLTRLYVDDSVDSTGEIYGYESGAIVSSGKPTTTTTIHITVAASKNQSEKASTSLSSQDYWIITGFRGEMLEKANGFADVALEVREAGKVFRQVEDVACSESHNGIFNFKPYHIVRPNSDIRLVAISDSTSRDVSGSIQGYLASIT